MTARRSRPRPARPIWRGLAGLHIVRDDAEEFARLCLAGPRELPLMIADRAFAADGTLDYPSVRRSRCGAAGGARRPSWSAVLGDVVLVNGAPWPVHEVDAVRYRLRLLNASNARHYELEAVTRRRPSRSTSSQVGADQGLLAAPRSPTVLPIAPAERYDVVVDFARCSRSAAASRLVNRLRKMDNPEVT